MEARSGVKCKVTYINCLGWANCASNMLQIEEYKVDGPSGYCHFYPKDVGLRVGVGEVHTLALLGAILYELNVR